MAGSIWLQTRPWVVPLWVAASVLAPIGLESAGMFEATWAVGDQMTARSMIIDTRASLATTVLLVGNIVFATMLGMFAVKITRTAREARRDLEIQAWQLQQLVPTRRDELKGTHGF